MYDDRYGLPFALSFIANNGFIGTSSRMVLGTQSVLQCLDYKGLRNTSVGSILESINHLNRFGSSGYEPGKQLF